MSEQSQRTEKATPRRVRKAREKGQYVSSKLLTGGLQFVVATALFSYFAGPWALRVAKVLSELLRRAGSGEVAPQQLIDLSRTSLIETMGPLVIGGVLIVVLSLLAQIFVTKLGISAAKVAPDLAKLNPWQKVRGMARENTISFAQGLVLIPFLLYVVFWLFQENVNLYLSMPRIGARMGSMLLTGQIETLMWKASGAFVVIGCLDYLRERHRYMKGLRMTKQEVKDEFKETEGNTEIKGKIRRMQRSQHRRMMMQNVKSATVVVVNPTHYSVALRYDPASAGAPVVVAKGKNLVALRIRTLASEHYVPIVENPPLARGLYSAVEVGQEIPGHLYRAVAEILAHVFKLMAVYQRQQSASQLH